MSKIANPANRLTSPGANIDGRAHAMMVLSLVPSWRVRAPRLVFGIGRRGSVPRIRELSFIYFARFALIRAFAHHGQPKDDLRGYVLQLFESNYSGTFDQYIDTFVDRAPGDLLGFWGASLGFPFRPGFSYERWHLPLPAFKRLIHLNEYVVDHYYVAYPDASPTIVASSLRVSKACARFRARLRQHGGEQITPADFRQCYRRLLAEVQEDL